MDEEDNSWKEFVDHTDPLPSKNKHLDPDSFSKKNIDRDQISRSRSEDSHISSMPIIDAYKQAGSLNIIDSGNTSRVDGATVKKIKSGKYPIDARLDLHGLTQEKAYNKLYRFIEAAYHGRKRCILVITGKGKEGKGVIRRHFQDWLSAPDINRLILYYCNAAPQHGGSGAYYLLLKKCR